MHPSAPNAPSYRLLAAVLLAVFVVPLSVSGTAVALADIAHDLGVNAAGQQWALNGFNVTFAASTLVWGSLADRIGRWRSFQIGNAIFIVASLVSFFAPDYWTLDGARLLAGLGAGAIFSVGSALLSVVFRRAQRARIFALMGAVAGLSLAFGPTLSGVITQTLGWAYIFALQGGLLAVAVVLMLGCRSVTRNEPRAQSALDWSAAALFFAFIAALVCALVLGSGDSGFHAPSQLSAVVGVLCLLGLIVRERHAPQPLLNVSLISHPRFLGVSLVVAVASFTFAALVTYAPSLLQATLRLSPAKSGMFVMFMTIPTLIAPLIAGALVGRGVSARSVLTVALALMVLGAAALSLAVNASALLMAVAMVVLGAGFGLHAGLVDNEGLAAAPQNEAGMAAGWINTLRVGSEAIAVSLFGAVFVPALAHSDPAAAFRHIGLISAGVALMVAIVSAVAMQRGGKSPSEK